MRYYHEISGSVFTDLQLAQEGISPQEFTSKGLYPIIETSKPIPGDYQMVASTGFTVINPAHPEDGYQEVYAVVEMFPQDSVETTRVAGTSTIGVDQQKSLYLDVLKASTKQEFLKLCQSRTSSGIKTTNGLFLDSTEGGLTRLSFQKSYSDLNPSEPVSIPGTDSSQIKQVSRADFLTAYTDLTVYLDKVNRSTVSSLQALDSAQSPSALQSILIAASRSLPSPDRSLPDPTTYEEFNLDYESGPEELYHAGVALPKFLVGGQVVGFDLSPLIQSPAVALNVSQVASDSTGSYSMGPGLTLTFGLGKPELHIDDTAGPGSWVLSSVRVEKIGG